MTTLDDLRTAAGHFTDPTEPHGVMLGQFEVADRGMRLFQALADSFIDASGWAGRLSVVLAGYPIEQLQPVRTVVRGWRAIALQSQSVEWLLYLDALLRLISERFDAALDAL